MEVSTITLNKNVKSMLDKIKSHPRESYNDALHRVLLRKSNTINNESLSETIAILSDPKIMMSLSKSLISLKKSKTYSIDEV